MKVNYKKRFFLILIISLYANSLCAMDSEVKYRGPNAIPSLQELTLAVLAKEKFQEEIDAADMDTVLTAKKDIDDSVTCLRDLNESYSTSILKYVRKYYPIILPVDDYEIKGGLVINGKGGPVLITLNAEKKSYGYRRRVEFWYLTNQAELAAYIVFEGQSVEAMAVDAAGTKLALGSAKGTIQLWDISTFQEAQLKKETIKLVGKFDELPGVGIEKLMFIAHESGDSLLLASATDKTVTFWDASLELVNRQGSLEQTHELKQTKYIGRLDLSNSFTNVLNFNTGAVKSWCWIPESSVLIVGKVNGVIEFFKMAYSYGRTFSSFASLSGPMSEVTALKVSSDNKVLMSGSHNGFITLWDINALPSMHRISTFKAHEGPIKEFEFFESNRVLVSGSLDGTMKTWNVETPIKPYLLKILRGMGAFIKIGVHSNDTLLSISDNNITVWQGASFNYTLCTHVLEKMVSSWSLLSFNKDLSKLRALLASLSACEKAALSALCDTAQVYEVKN
jgi:WD40 repeat protein